MIDKNEAPEGYIAIEPINYDKNGNALCYGCYYIRKKPCGQGASPQRLCEGYYRQDRSDVIFTKKKNRN